MRESRIAALHEEMDAIYSANGLYWQQERSDDAAKLEYYRRQDRLEEVLHDLAKLKRASLRESGRRYPLSFTEAVAGLAQVKMLEPAAKSPAPNPRTANSRIRARLCDERRAYGRGNVRKPDLPGGSVEQRFETGVLSHHD